MRRSRDEDSPAPHKTPHLASSLIADIVNEGESVPEIDEYSTRVCIQALEKAICHNQESRLRYSDEPLKFRSSEEDLFNAILKFKSLSVDSASFSLVIDSSGLENLVGLLGHSNPDIVTCVLEVILDWCDDESQIEAHAIDRLLGAEIISVVGAVLDRTKVSRDNDSELIYHALSLLEALYECRPEEIEKESAGNIAKWLLRQLEEADEEFSTNKLYVSEMLSILLSSAGNQAKVAEMRGVECVLKAIITCSALEATTDDERELTENLFDCMCNLLLSASALATFRKIKGLSALLHMMRLQKPIPDLALKTIDVALEGSAEVAGDFIMENGLKIFFPLFLKSAKKSKKTQRCVISILYSLYKNVPPQLIPRLHCKLTENEFEKLQLVHFYYDQFSESLAENPDKSLSLQALQHLSFIVASLCKDEKPQTKTYIQSAFNIVKLREMLEDWHRALDDEEVCGADLRVVLPQLAQGLV